jgi:hypothetical protein
MVDRLIMVNWGFLTNHAWVLMCIAHDSGARLRDIAASLGNRYQIQAHLPLPEAGGGNLDCSSDLVMPGPSR